MGGILSKLRQDVETKSIYYFFRKCFIILRNPPLKLDLIKTKKLLLSVIDEDEIEDILHEINTLLGTKHNYKAFISHSAINVLMKRFISSEHNINDLTIRHMAALEGDTFLIGKILTYELIPNFKSSIDNTGKTPLHHASISGKVKVINQLLNTEVAELEKFINIQDDFGKTSLHLAAFDNKKNAATKLIRKGADIDIKDALGCKPIHLALLKKLTPMVKLLECEGADIHEPINGKPLALIAYDYGDIELLNYLLNMKIDISTTHDGTTLIHQICADKNAKLLRKIIKLYDQHGEEDLDDEPISIFEQENNAHQTAFRIACENNFYSGMRLLSRIGVDVDHKIDGNTALHEACLAEQFKMVRSLLLLGADPTILNSDGLNCLDIVTRITHTDLTELIKAYIPEQIIEFEIIFEIEAVGIVTDTETASSNY